LQVAVQVLHLLELSEGSRKLGRLLGQDGRQAAALFGWLLDVMAVPAKAPMK
jgi:predicted RNA-binding protein YlqC (UPF0109 family)